MILSPKVELRMDVLRYFTVIVEVVMGTWSTKLCYALLIK